MGKPPALHEGAGFESNVAAFVLRPKLLASPVFDSGKIRVRLNPLAREGQRVVLLLNEWHEPPDPAPASPRAYNLSVRIQQDTDTIEVETVGVQAGKYLLRVQVDGAESQLQLSSGNVSGPLIDVGSSGPPPPPPPPTTGLKIRAATIELTDDTVGAQFVVRARVTVRDENDERIQDAKVFVTWTPPDRPSESDLDALVATLNRARQSM